MKKLNLLFATLITLSLAFSTSAFADDTQKKVHKKKAQHTTTQHAVKNKKHATTQHAANTKHHNKKKSNKSKNTNAA